MNLSIYVYTLYKSEFSQEREGGERERERELQNHFKRIKEGNRRVNLSIYVYTLYKKYKIKIKIARL